MNDEQKKSILQMAKGAFEERADYEMGRIIDNILDPNTDPKAKRTLTLTLTLTPDDARQTVGVSCVAKSKMAPTNPVVTMLYVSDKKNVLEMCPQIPGQFAISGTEEDEPVMLRVVSGGK